MSETYEQKVSQGMLAAGTGLVRELREMTAERNAAEKTIIKLREAIKDFGSAPERHTQSCIRFGYYTRGVYMCSVCPVIALCIAFKESKR